MRGLWRQGRDGNMIDFLNRTMFEKRQRTGRDHLRAEGSTCSSRCQTLDLEGQRRISLVMALSQGMIVATAELCMSNFSDDIIESCHIVVGLEARPRYQVLDD